MPKTIIYFKFLGSNPFTETRDFLLFSMKIVETKSRYVHENTHRMEYNAFYFSINGNKSVKEFFKSILAISGRPKRMVLGICNVTTTGMCEIDKRGKYGKLHKVHDSIKRAWMESHYCWKDCIRECFDCSKTLAELHRNYFD